MDPRKIYGHIARLEPIVQCGAAILGLVMGSAASVSVLVRGWNPHPLAGYVAAFVVGVLVWFVISWVVMLAVFALLLPGCMLLRLYEAARHCRTRQHIEDLDLPPWPTIIASRPGACLLVFRPWKLFLGQDQP